MENLHVIQNQSRLLIVNYGYNNNIRGTFYRQLHLIQRWGNFSKDFFFFKPSRIFSSMNLKQKFSIDFIDLLDLADYVGFILLSLIVIWYL
jgi:hypothetical protein